MDIGRLLAEDRVLWHLPARSKKRALEALAEALSHSSANLTPEEIFTSLINRERLGSTGLGSGVALPHGRVSGLKEPVAAFASLEEPIDFGSIDDQPVDLLFALLVPEEEPDAHLALLAALARLFSDPAFTRALRQGKTAAELWHLLRAEHGRAPA